MDDILVIDGDIVEYKLYRFATYMTKASFGIYILHYIVTLYGCYGLMYRTALLIYGIAIILVPVFSVVFYEGIRRIPLVRFLVLGR